MITVKIPRNLTLVAAIADAVGHSGDKNGTVLIAGSEHVRCDAGVPVHLTRMLPEVLVIGFVETAKRKGAHSILWFTEPGPNRDYCADLAKRFRLKDKPATWRTVGPKPEAARWRQWLIMATDCSYSSPIGYSKHAQAWVLPFARMMGDIFPDTMAAFGVSHRSRLPRLPWPSSSPSAHPD